MKGGYLGQRATLHELHDQEDPHVVDVGVNVLDNVRVLQLHQHLQLDQVALLLLGCDVGHGFDGHLLAVGAKALAHHAVAAPSGLSGRRVDGVWTAGLA